MFLLPPPPQSFHFLWRKSWIPSLYQLSFHFSLSYTSGLCIFVGDVNSSCVTHDGSFSSTDLPTWTESSLLPWKTGSDSTSGLGDRCVEKVGICGRWTPDPSVRIPLHQRSWAQPHPTAGPELGGFSKLLPHSFDIYFYVNFCHLVLYSLKCVF